MTHKPPLAARRAGGRWSLAVRRAGDDGARAALPARRGRAIPRPASRPAAGRGR